MSARIASRWLPRPAAAAASSPQPRSALLCQVRRRSWFGLGRSDGDSDSDPKPKPKPASADAPKLSRADLSPKTGDLAGSSLFDDADLAPAGLPLAAPAINPLIRDPERHKWSWPKRADAREHRRRGRLTKKELLLRTEKAHTAKSHFIKTSLKKLGPLARQIAGKNIEDAIVQMRFSVKKAAGDVMGHLKQARNEAVLRRAMDPKVTYIEQAWVGRGTYGQASNHRAKGRIDRLRLPYTSITVVLKEEATRNRIAAEKEAKALRKKPWVHLPSRPIYGQTQYYRW